MCANRNGKLHKCWNFGSLSIRHVLYRYYQVKRSSSYMINLLNKVGFNDSELSVYNVGEMCAL